MLLPGRLFLLILFRRWPARPPLVLSSLLGVTLQLFDFLSYSQLCHFWLTLPKPRMFSSRSCRIFMYAYQETRLGAGLALRFWGSSATFGQFWEAGESKKKAGNHFPHNWAFILLYPTCTQKDTTTYFSGCRAITFLCNGPVAHKHQLLEIAHKIVPSPLPALLSLSTPSLF